MGREIRRVPPNWNHPKGERHWGAVDYLPMYDRSFDEAWQEWLADFDRIRAGDLTDMERECYPRGLVDWLHDEPIPEPSKYRPWHDDEATWFQVWETVSEGTPVTPPFATADELIDYLAANGDFWTQRRGMPPPSRAQAEAFVKSGWAPSFVVSIEANSATIADSYQSATGLPD